MLRSYKPSPLWVLFQNLSPGRLSRNISPASFPRLFVAVELAGWRRDFFVLTFFSVCGCRGMRPTEEPVLESVRRME